jgi:hypothetical protein
MPPPSARPKKETVQQQAEAQEAKRRQDNARKAKKAVDKLFPGEKWEQKKEWGDNIYVSARKKRGQNTGYAGELRDAKILCDLGSTVYLIPEPSTPGGKHDAIVNGLRFEFKNVGGNSNTLMTHFLISRTQAPNVFINLETSKLTKQEIMSSLIRARNSITHTDKRGNIIKGYNDINQFPEGGRILLKIPGRNNLIYLNVDDLKK